MKLSCCVVVLLCWLPELVEMMRIINSCPPAPRIKNGKHRYRQRQRFVKYSCNLGFVLYGERYNNCVHGKWDGPAPRCVRPGCKKVNAPNNGSIYPTFSGAVLHFFCKPGYEIHGPEVTHCNGTAWSTNMPICLVSSTKPPLSCDFENPDLCGWTHDLNHDFDWRRMQFSTPSGAIGTGPSRDHTIGSKADPNDPSSPQSGYYMYIESSSKNENDTARLISPVYEKTLLNTCFIFYYHMYGSTIGTLRVYLKLVNDSSDFEPHKAFFQEHGNHGDRWIRFIHLFDSIPNDYQIVIEGVSGNGYVSDMAIDDVSIVNDCNLDDFQEAELSTTTETGEYSTTDYLPDDFYSCEGRCYSTSIPVGKHRICSCDENCFERNQCCPDFIDFCLLNASGFELFTETTFTDSPLTTPSTQKATHKTITISTTTPSPIKITTKEVITTAQPVDTITTLKEQTTLKALETTKITTVVTSTTEDDEIDELDEDININPTWEETNDIPNDIPMFPKDEAPIEDVAHLKRNSNEKIVILKYQEKSSPIRLFHVLGICFLVAGLVLIVARRMKGKKSRRFRSGSHGGSASDVRFLTSDELLDLNLEYE